MQLSFWPQYKYPKKSMNRTPHQQNSPLLHRIWRLGFVIYLPNYVHGTTFLKTAKIIITTFRTSSCTTKDAVVHNHTKKQEQGRQFAHSCNVILRRARVTSVAIETQTCFPFVLLTYIWHCQQFNKYRKLWHVSTVTLSLYCCSTYFAANNMKPALVST